MDKNIVGMKSKLWINITLMVIILTAALFRFDGINWDQGQHLHPDERFLTMVASQIRFPSDGYEYFDTLQSSLNPHNVGFPFYVYGTYPIFLLRYLCDLTGRTSYNQLVITGRYLSGFFDMLTLLFVFLIVRRLSGSLQAVFASALYGFAVLPIQLSHFFIVDTIGATMVTGVMMAAIYCLYPYSEEPVDDPTVHPSQLYRFCIIGGILTGLAAAAKISLGAVGLLIPLIMVMELFRPRSQRLSFMQLAAGGTMAFALFIFVFRVLQPYAFAGPGLFNMSLNPAWIQNLKELSSIADPYSGFPPALQWAERPIWFSWFHMTFWGFNPITGILLWIGLIAYCFNIYAKKNRALAACWLWGVAFFLWQSMQINSTMRYQLPFYPQFIIWGCLGLHWICIRSKLSLNRKPMQILCLFMCLISLLWAVAFTSIYRTPHTRVSASRWIYQNIPSGSVIALESVWDDGLPLRIDGHDGFATMYTGIYLDIYAQDSPQKKVHFDQILATADFLVISSNRQWASIGRLPRLYPLTVQFYADLVGCQETQTLLSCYASASAGIEAGPLGYKLAAVFESYPRIGSIMINDQLAEEAFTVYDHPKVLIFQRQER
jgi:hypothetical protein